MIKYNRSFFDPKKAVRGTFTDDIPLPCATERRINEMRKTINTQKHSRSREKDDIAERRYGHCRARRGYLPAARGLVLIAALAILLSSCIAGQSGTDNTGADTTAAVDLTNENGTQIGAQTEVATPNIPATLNYNNTELNVLICKEQKKQTIGTEDSDLVLSDVLATRVSRVQSALGVTLSFIEEPGNWNNRASFISKVDASVSSGSDYDLIIAYNLIPPTLAVRGLICDLNESEYTDFSKPWWPERLIDIISIKDRVYFAVDNSSYGSIRNMACIMFRKDVADEYSLTPDGLYSTVLDGEWTLDKMEELITGTYRDLNSNNTFDYGDRFGFACVDKPRLDAFFHGSGLTIVGKNSDGSFSMTLGDEKVQTVLERMNSLFDNENSYMADNQMYAMIESGQVLFYCTPVAIVDRKLDFDFGVLPIPKFNGDQQSYITYMSNTHDSLCVTKGARDTDMSADVIEYLAYSAYIDVAPKYFEVMLKFKYSSDSSTGQIYDIIRRNAMFDFGYIFSESFSTNPILLYRNAVIAGAKSWTTTYRPVKSKLEEDLANIMAQMSGD